MTPSAGGFSFGPFELDVQSRRLVRLGEDGAPIPLSELQFDLLQVFVSRPGDLLTRDVLIGAAWRDVAVGDNNLDQAISRLRRLLDAGDRERYVETVSGLGYRFAVPVTRIGVGRTDAELDALLLPHRALIDGRAALETLERSEIARARATFEPLLLRHGNDAAVQVGFANACVLQFESTRADPAPDVEALHLAATHAREACRLDAAYGEAWATLGFVLERTGDRTDALAALRHSVTIEPDNWRHWLRLCSASWGEERLRAARRTLALMPECPPARLLAATVFVSRGALDLAEREVDAGLAAMPGTGGSSPPARFSIVGLYWLAALLCLARGAGETAGAAEADEAIAMLERELALDARGHLYAREMAANAWYAMGAVRLRRADAAGARDAFRQAMARVPHHLMARAGLDLVQGVDVGLPAGNDWSIEPLAAGSLNHRPRNEAPATAVAATLSVDAAIARATLLVAHGDTAGAAALVARVLASAPAGSAGWLIPIEPLLRVQRNHAAWAAVLTMLRARAA